MHSLRYLYYFLSNIFVFWNFLLQGGGLEPKCVAEHPLGDGWWLSFEKQSRENCPKKSLWKLWIPLLINGQYIENFFLNNIYIQFFIPRLQIFFDKHRWWGTIKKKNLSEQLRNRQSFVFAKLTGIVFEFTCTASITIKTINHLFHTNYFLLQFTASAAKLFVNTYTYTWLPSISGWFLFQ